MASAAIPAVLAREVIRCATCHLVQFKTRDGNCRKCHKSFVPVEVAPSPVSKLQRCSDSESFLAGKFPGSADGGWFDKVIPFAVWYFRTKRGMSQRDVGKLLGVPRTYLSKLENGNASPTFSSLMRLAKAFDVDPGYIVLFCEAVCEACVVPSPDKSGKETILAPQNAAPEFGPKDYHYCVTKGCKYKVPRIATVLNPCPNDGATEYVDSERKSMIEKGVPSAQAKAKDPKDPPAGAQLDSTGQQST